MMLMIKDKQQLLNIITNNLEVYMYGKDEVMPIEIRKCKDIEIVIYTERRKNKAMDYETFIGNIKLRRIFK